MENLAIAIRTNPNIHGIESGGTIHKWALFADDLLLFIKDPITTLPNLFALLSSFRAISGLWVDQLKSEALNLISWTQPWGPYKHPSFLGGCFGSLTFI